MKHGKRSAKPVQPQNWWPSKSRKYHVRRGDRISKSRYGSKSTYRDRYGKYHEGRQVEPDIIAGTISIKR